MTSATFREQTETEDRRSWPVFQYVTYHIISHVGDKNCVKIVSILCNCHSGWALIWYYGFCYFQKQVFEPPHRRLEDRDEHQKNMEEAFEDMYMADTSMRSRCLYWMFQIKTIVFTLLLLFCLPLLNCSKACSVPVLHNYTYWYWKPAWIHKFNGFSIRHIW